MINLFRIITKLYSIKMIVATFAIFILIRIPNLHIIPDYLNLGEIENPDSYILTLLSIVIGFSSFILTILIIVYNSFSKKIRRNSFDFVLGNPWIKTTFSIFSSSLFFIFLVMMTLKVSDRDSVITFLYISSILAFSNLIIQFPLLILSIKHSNSYDIIERLIKEVSKNDLDEIFKPERRNNNISIDTLEKNKIIQLKDIGIVAIKQNDWGLPQTIVNNLYEKLIYSLKENSFEDEILYNLSAFSFISQHFKKTAFEQSDEITIRVLLNRLISANIHLAKSKIRNIRSNPLDSTILGLVRVLIENNLYYEFQPYLLSQLSEIIEEHIDSIKCFDPYKTRVIF